MSTQDYLRYFPFSKVRPSQDRAIEFALSEFEAGKRFVILELPVGVGKSATGLTVSRAIFPKMLGDHSGAYFLTTQKVLQDQYERDFGPNALGVMRSIKSASNYKCVYHPDKSCGQSKRLLEYVKDREDAKDFKKVCSNSCPYSKSKNDFMQSELSVTNFSYFLTETTYAKKLEPRHMLVIDEAHNIESELSKFIEVTFSEKFAKEVLKVKFPELKQTTVSTWIKTNYYPALKKSTKKIEKELIGAITEGKDSSDLGKRHEALDKHLGKIEKFIETYEPKNWVMNIVEPPPGKTGKKIEFKPINVSKYSEEVLFRFGEKVLMMSATILNKEAFCRSLGIPIDNTSFLSLPSPFPPENRPIHYLPVGSMSKNSIDSTLPKMVQVIREIIDQHKDQKGILHAANYKVAKYLFENLKSSRVLTHDSSNRDVILERHIKSPEPTILLSPSMMEGVDLADDASRFQVICKVPFPYLGDIMIQKRMEQDDLWYSYQTAKLIIQSLGRSIRNENDHATSYILDSDWEHFWRRNKDMFPSDFSKSLI